MHSGMTSSDVLDTCFNVQLVRAADILIADIDALLAALKRRAFEYKMTPTVGRSHGIHAEPTTFGLKLAYAYAEFARASERLAAARKEVATCAISGAVGTFAQVDPRVEAHVAKAMGLAVEPVSTQIIPRDRHAMYFATLGVDRLLDRATGDRNPPSAAHRSAGGRGIFLREAEGLLGDAAQAQPGPVGKRHRPCAHGARLCHAGDGERGALARARHLALLGRAHDRSGRNRDARFRARAAWPAIIDKLIVYPDTMQKNLDRLGGLIHSQRVLIALTQKGVAREDAYRLVQRNAMKVWSGERRFPGAAQGRQGRAREAAPTRSSRPISTSTHHFKHVDTIFKRVFGSTEFSRCPAPTSWCSTPASAA